MILLLLSIISSTIIYALFKVFGLWKLRTFQAIVANYFTAAVFGIYAAGYNAQSDVLREPWLPMAVLTGILFISLFYLMAHTSQVNGVAPTSVASKMSMLIPVAWFIISDPDEKAGVLKIAAIFIGLTAVLLATSKKQKPEGKQPIAWLLIVLFIGSGLLDLTLAYTEKFMLHTVAVRLQFTAIPFATAFLLGSMLLAWRIFRKQECLHVNSLLAGIVLGLVNYASIHFLLATLGSGFMSRSAILPSNNMGIVALSTLVGVLAFRERLTGANIIGVVLAVLSIGLLIFEEA